MDGLSVWQTIVSQASALLLGAVGGGVVSALVTWRMLRESTARDLLSEALNIQALMEAWILEGPGYLDKSLSSHKDLPTQDPTNSTLWLRQVEVRSVLDEAEWNSPLDQCYGFIAGRRTWIVRDQVKGARSAYSGALRDGYHPALLSSRALEDLCGWIERVASARHGWQLSKHGLKMLRPLLAAVATEDRLKIFGERLLPEAQQFLEWYRKQ